MPLVIGLEGKARHGKGRAAELISEELHSRGFTFEFVSFSSVIHEECAEIVSKEYGIDYEEALSWMREEKYKDSYNETLSMSPRKMMQDHGNKKRKEVDPNYFIDIALSSLPNVDVVINDSVRFDNEIYNINKIGGETIRVFNPNVEIKESNDPTENGITEHSKITIINTYHDGSEDEGCSFYDECLKLTHETIIPLIEKEPSLDI